MVAQNRARVGDAIAPTVWFRAAFERRRPPAGPL